jgi:hypothetical protein
MSVWIISQDTKAYKLVITNLSVLPIANLPLLPLNGLILSSCMYTCLNVSSLILCGRAGTDLCLLVWKDNVDAVRIGMTRTDDVATVDRG